MPQSDLDRYVEPSLETEGRPLCMEGNTPPPIVPTVRILAAYLPQFHPIPENDSWWGKGFTEWTNVRKAQPLFPGHDQPRAPADLGYYDLRRPDVRRAQADLARAYGVHGFCYWHYWFGEGRRLLERPMNEVLASGQPDFPFCLAWANHSWKDKTFRRRGSGRVLIEQRYPGREDCIRHFNALLSAFRDPRYIRVKGKPLFYVYGPGFIPKVEEFLALWRDLARKNGLGDMHFVAQTYDAAKIARYLSRGFDAVNIVRLFDFVDREYGPLRRLFVRFLLFHLHRGMVVEYAPSSRHFVGEDERAEDCYPSIFPNWDPSPRTGRQRHILVNSSPSAFRQHVLAALDAVKHKTPEDRIVFLKSWNEWAEGNYMEPDTRFGRGYLDALRDALLTSGCARPASTDTLQTKAAAGECGGDSDVHPMRRVTP